MIFTTSKIVKFKWNIFSQEISAVAMDLSGTLENVVNQLKEFQQRMDAYKPKMDELEGYNQVNKYN